MQSAPHLRGAALLTVLLLLPLTSSAQDRIVHRVNVDATDQDLSELMRQIGRKTGHNILVAEHVEERVTIRLYDISWRDAVEVIARMAGCKLRQLPGGVLLLTQPQKVHIQLEHANVRTALLLLASYARKSIVIGSDVEGTISLDLRDVDWTRALHAVASSAGDYAVITEDDLVTVGGAGERARDPDAEPVLSGRFLAREGEQVRVVLESGDEIRCALPEAGRLRRRLVDALARLRAGDRIVFSYQGSVADGLVLTNLVAHAR